MIRAVIFAAIVAGITAQNCVPPVITHTETGDDLYKALLCDLNNAENAAAAISASSQGNGGCTKFENLPDFFTQLLVTINADNAWLDKVGGGWVPGGNECIGVNLRIDFDLKNIQGKADTPVVPATPCPPTSGAAYSQYTLQQFGRSLAALGAAPAGPTPPGPWQKYVQDLNAGIASVRTIIANNDAAGCPAATATLANALKGIRLSCPPQTTTMAYAASG